MKNLKTLLDNIRQKFVTEIMEKNLKKKLGYYCTVQDEKMNDKHFGHISFQEEKDEKGEPTGKFKDNPALSVDVVVNPKNSKQAPFCAKMYRYDEKITDGHYQRIPTQGLSSGFNMKFVIRVGSIYVDKTHVSLKMELASGLVAESCAEEEYFEIKKRPVQNVVMEEDLSIGC